LRQLRTYIIQLAAAYGLPKHRHDRRGVIACLVDIYAFPFADAPEEFFEGEAFGVAARTLERFLKLLRKLGGGRWLPRR
jgi:hypothetical protein